MARFVPNPGPWLTAVLNGSAIASVVAAEAERIAAAARALAPVDTGDYRASITATTQPGDGRVVGIVEATSDHALVVEYGGRGTTAHHVLGRAAGA